MRVIAKNKTCIFMKKTRSNFIKIHYKIAIVCNIHLTCIAHEIKHKLISMAHTDSS